MFGMDKIGALFTPENMALVNVKIPQFMAMWTNKLNDMSIEQGAILASVRDNGNHLNTKLDAIGEKLDRLEAAVRLLATPTAIDADIHETALCMSMDDPRNRMGVEVPDIHEQYGLDMSQ